jgi:hypothetical protein
VGVGQMQDANALIVGFVRHLLSSSPLMPCLNPTQPDRAKAIAATGSSGSLQFQRDVGDAAGRGNERLRRAR